MTGRGFAPLAWLLLRGVRNRAVRRLRRVREPRYALAVLAGMAYFWLVFFRPNHPSPVFAAPLESTAHLAAAFGLAVLAASWWLLGNDEPALHFTMAEVQLLFPAPVTRRQLVALKLLQAQSVILFSTLIWVFLFHGGALPRPARAVALWAIFSTLHLHRTGASLVRASTMEHGTAGARHNIVALVVAAGAAGAVGLAVIQHLTLLRAAAAGGHMLGALVTILHAPLVKGVLFPFRLVLAPLFAQTLGEWARAIGPALLVVAAHYVWVVRTDTAFEESAAENAAKRAHVIAAARKRGMHVRVKPGGPARFRIPLAPGGAPIVAIVWKNILALARTFALRTLIAIAALGVAMVALAGSILPDAQSVGEVAGTAALVFAGVLVFIGPLWVRNDLRLDMLQLELLRSYPLRGAWIVRAEVAGSAAVLTVLQVVLLVVAYAAIPIEARLGYTLGDRTALMAAALVVVPTVNALGFLVQNAVALIFPAWIRLGLSRPGGVEAIGQGVLTAFGSTLALALLLLAPAVVGGALGAIVVSQTGLWGLLPGALLAAALVLGEFWLATAWLGRTFDRTEPLTEGLVE